MLYLILFILTSGLMIHFARRLTVSGEGLGEALGLEASWVGVLLLASITSLPELIVGSGAVFMGNHSMAVANIFGSNVFNLFIIFLMDVFILRSFTFTGMVDREEGMKLSGLTVVLTLIFIGGFFMKDMTLVGQSPFILAIFGLYVSFLKKSSVAGEKKKVTFEEIKKPLKVFTLDSVGVVLLGLGLSKLADIIAVTPILGIVLGQSVVGALLLAVATSLPELTVSIESVRRGNCQQAMGNILGSNLFNMSTLLVLDVFTKGSLMSYLGDFSVSTVYICLIMHGILFGGLYFSKRSISPVVGILYMISLYFVF